MPSPSHNISTGFCRDCLARQLPETTRCSQCGSFRLLHHSELFELSLAHLDCDAFYAAIEKRDDPSLADKPLIMGGGKRGVVSTCCYIARTYGIHSAMPMFQALKACPHAVVRKPDNKRISQASRAIRAEMEALTPLVQPLSSDEAFMDMSGTEKLHGTPPAITLAALVLRIEKKIGITVSIGLSHNKFLAKIASDYDKPRGFAVIGQAETLSFLADKPINFIWGVGKAFSTKLAQDGLHTIRDLQRASPADLARHYGAQGLRLAELAKGKDPRPVSPHSKTKSISSETTFHQDLHDYKTLENILWDLTEKVSDRMKKAHYTGHVVILKMKTSQFRTLTRRRTLAEPTNLAGLIFRTGCSLLREIVPEGPSRPTFRLIGIGLSGLNTKDTLAQPQMFVDDHSRLAAREQAIDNLREKFGPSAIGTGRGLGQAKKITPNHK